MIKEKDLDTTKTADSISENRESSSDDGKRTFKCWVCETTFPESDVVYEKFNENDEPQGSPICEDCWLRSKE